MLTAATCEACNERYLMRAQTQRWCTKCVPNKVARHRMRSYGMSQKKFDEMAKEQNGLCALCPNPLRVVDHCHQSNVVRGLLCQACNIALGRVDSPGWLDKVAAYLARSKN